MSSNLDDGLIIILANSVIVTSSIIFNYAGDIQGTSLLLIMDMSIYHDLSRLKFKLTFKKIFYYQKYLSMGIVIIILFTEIFRRLKILILNLCLLGTI